MTNVDVIAPNDLLSCMLNERQEFNNEPADAAMSKEELIQKATLRLRGKILHEGLSAMTTRVSALQKSLEGLHIEADTTTNVLTKFDPPDERQLAALERRFHVHEQQWMQILMQAQQQQESSDNALSPCASNNNNNNNRKPILPANAVSASTSFSSTLSRMSSIFSRESASSSFEKKKKKKPTTRIKPEKPTSTSPYRQWHEEKDDDEDDDDDIQTDLTSEDDALADASASVQEAHERRRRRRRRVQHLRREYQERLRLYDPTWNVDDWQSAKSPSSSSSIVHAIRPATSPQQQRHQQHSIRHRSPSVQLSASSSSNSSTCSSSATESSATEHPSTATAIRQPPMASHQALPFRRTRSQDDSPMMAPSAVPTTMTNSQQHIRSWVLDQQQAFQPSANTTPAAAADMQTFHDVMQRLNTAQSEINSHVGHDLSQLLFPAAHLSPDQHLFLHQQWRHHQQAASALPLSASMASFAAYANPLLYQEYAYQPPYHQQHAYARGPSSAAFDPRLYQLPYLVLMLKQGIEKTLQLVFLIIDKGLSWVKFLSVISISLLISLGHGPEHMLLSMDEWDDDVDVDTF